MSIVKNLLTGVDIFGHGITFRLRSAGNDAGTEKEKRLTRVPLEAVVEKHRKHRKHRDTSPISPLFSSLVFSAASLQIASRTTPFPLRSLPIYIFPMTDVKNRNNFLLIIYLINHPIIANPYSPTISTRQL
jgi:hypothetical protein